MKKIMLFIFSFLSLVCLSQDTGIRKVLPNSVVSNQYFARRVAIDGNTMVVSSGGSEVVGIKDNILAYVYERTGSNQWTQTQILHHSDFLNYSLGHTVAIFEGFIFISIHGITNQNRHISRVGVYAKNASGHWEKSQELSLHGSYGGSYGYSIVAKNEQLIIWTRAKEYNNKLDEYTKHADVYELANGKWVWKSELLSEGIAEYNELGNVVAIEGDKAFINGYYSDPTADPVWFSTITVKDERGKIILQKTSPCKIEERKLYVFSNKGNKWLNTQILESWDGKGWGFGNAFTSHGDFLAVAAYRASIKTRKNSGGAVYIFKKDGDGDYRPFQRIMANDVHKIQLFGSAVAMNNQYLIVGSKHDKLNANGFNKRDRTGACYVFQKDTNGMFVQTQKFVSDKRQKMGRFGRDVAISGNNLVIGSGYQSVKPKYRGDFHDEGAVFTAELKPITADKIEIENQPFLSAIVQFDSTINSDVQGKGLEVSVFPNPTNGNFTLKRKVGQNSEVIIYTSNGKEIYREDFKDLEQHFAIEGWPSGLYYVQINSSGIVQNLKLILID